MMIRTLQNTLKQKMSRCWHHFQKITEDEIYGDGSNSNISKVVRTLITSRKVLCTHSKLEVQTGLKVVDS